MVHQRSKPVVELHAHQYELDGQSQSALIFFHHLDSSLEKLWVLPKQNGEQICLHLTKLPIFGHHKAVFEPLSLLFQDDKSHELISEMLFLPPQESQEVHDWIINAIISLARYKIQKDSTKGNKLWVMIVKITINSLNVLHKSDMNNVYVKRWIEAHERRRYGMVPATMLSVARLEKVRLDSSESCSVCLEELPAGSAVTRMQCSHVFHAKCIGEWLKNSHYCPVCRFEMPTN